MMSDDDVSCFKSLILVVLISGCCCCLAAADTIDGICSDSRLQPEKDFCTRLLKEGGGHQTSPPNDLRGLGKIALESALNVTYRDLDYLRVVYDDQINPEDKKIFSDCYAYLNVDADRLESCRIFFNDRKYQNMIREASRAAEGSQNCTARLPKTQSEVLDRIKDYNLEISNTAKIILVIADALS